MGGARLLFSLPGCVFSLLGCVVVVAGRGDEQRYSTITSPEQELYNDLRPEIRDTDFIHPLHPPPAASTPPYLLLPMFLHQSSPAVSKQLLSPVAGSSGLPSALASILIPQGLQPYIRVTPVNNDHGVEVWCGYSKIFVRIHLDLLRFRSTVAHFRLGTCPASRADRSFLYFLYDLNECGSLLSVIQEKLLYANEVIYRPETQGAVIRAVPLTLPVQCVYDRFHYSYKVGYLPELRPQSFRKTLVRKQDFSLSVRNEKWEELGMNSSYTLGEPMYFEVGVEFIPKDKNVYIEACHVAASEDSNSTQSYDVINNFGCMVDSKRTGSQSHYILRQLNVLRFSLDAFSFAEAASERFYLRCTVLLGHASVSTTAKSCTYVESEHRWEELDGENSVCDCCESRCRPPSCPDLAWCAEQAAVISKPWSLTRRETSDEWLDAPSGSVLLRHHPAEGVEPGAESEEESVREKEEFCVGEELEEEVLIGVAEAESDGDAVNVAKENENVDAEEEEAALRKTQTRRGASAGDHTRTPDSGFRGDVSETSEMQ